MAKDKTKTVEEEVPAEPTHAAYEPPGYWGSVYSPNALLLDEIAAVLKGGEATADVEAWVAEWSRINAEKQLKEEE